MKKKKKLEQPIDITIDEEMFNNHINDQYEMGETIFNMMVDMGIFDKKETEKFLSEMKQTIPPPIKKDVKK